MRWVLHIGIQKTGSKAIQTFLASYAGMIPDARVCFPEAGKDLNLLHESLYWALLEGDSHHLADAAAETAAQDWDIGVFSCEVLHELPSQRLPIIKDHLGDPQIILFIRHQPEAINSLLNQYVKARRVSFDDIADFRKSMTSYNSKFDYEATLSKWAAAFGDDAITPVIYDKKIDAVSLFCDALGISLPARYKPAENTNPSLDSDTYERFLSEKAQISDENDLWKTVSH